MSRRSRSSTYLGTGHFGEATFENWESEFLQMAFYVLLTIYLYQVGSSESKRPDTLEIVDLDPRDSPQKDRAPWPVRTGGLVLVLYEHSLSLAFALLFLASLTLHAITGVVHYNEERMAHGEPAATIIEYASSSQFWFESFQNWQSEFLSLAAMVGFTIFLRQRGSPESKPVDAPWESAVTNGSRRASQSISPAGIARTSIRSHLANNADCPDRCAADSNRGSTWTNASAGSRSSQA